MRRKHARRIDEAWERLVQPGWRGITDAFIGLMLASEPAGGYAHRQEAKYGRQEWRHRCVGPRLGERSRGSLQDRGLVVPLHGRNTKPAVWTRPFPPGEGGQDSLFPDAGQPQRPGVTKRGAGGLFSAAQKIEAFNVQFGICVWCGIHMGHWELDVEADHVWPFSRGGPTDMPNVDVMHHACNSDKRDSTDFWGGMRRRVRYLAPASDLQKAIDAYKRLKSAFGEWKPADAAKAAADGPETDRTTPHAEDGDGTRRLM